MLKQINRVLKLVGLNLVRAKRKNRTKPNPNYRPVPENQEGTPYDASKYTGDAEWQTCGDLDQPRVEQPDSDNKTSGPTS